MSRPDNFFKTLAGVSVHYDRPPLAPYGSGGVSYDFHATKDLENKLDKCFAQLWQVCPLGKPEVIVSAGAWVAKPGYHGDGEAFDLDGLHWSHKSFMTLNYPTDRHLYLGIEAVLRKHFGTVLNYHYNLDHRDHLHLDSGGEIGFSRPQNQKYFFYKPHSHIFCQFR